MTVAGGRILPRHLPRHLPRRVLLTLTVAALLASVSGVLLAIANGEGIGGTFLPDLFIVGTLFVVVGALLVDRVPGNRIGWILLIAGWLWSADLLIGQYAFYGAITAPGTVPAVGLATWLDGWLWLPGTGLLLFALPLLFPDGELPSAQWRPIAVVGTLVITIAAIGHALVIWPIRDTAAPLLDSFDASAEPGIAGTITGFGDMCVFLIVPLLGLMALVSRYRSSRGVVRLQLRWMVLAVAVAIASMIVDILMQELAPGLVGIFSAVGLALLPVAIGIAVLRYRLYDLDRLVSRTVAYGLLTGVLVAAYVTLTLVLSGPLGSITGGGNVSVAISTLIVAALFQPVRGRIQRVVDRRFDRARYDGERTAAAFSGRLRDEVDLPTLATNLDGTVRAALAPSTVAIWLRDGRP